METQTEGDSENEAVLERGGSGLDLTGQLLDSRYHVSKLLGRGGFGSVFLATDERSFGRRVVVKVPHPEFLAEPGFRKRFEKEIQSLVALEHPNVVKVVDTGVLGQVPYAVMQYLNGGSLADRLATSGGKQGPAELRRWLGFVASALDFIHRKGILHRDVKPANILFDDEGHVYLSDFGIAKALETTGTQLTQAGRVPGSPMYMAPEALLKGNIGPAYDQFALGVVAYQALSGSLPHEGETPLAILFQRATQPAKPLGPLAPNVPQGAVLAVMRALEIDATKRFENCTAFTNAFEDGLRRPHEVSDAPTAEIAVGALREVVPTGSLQGVGGAGSVRDVAAPGSARDVLTPGSARSVPVAADSSSASFSRSSEMSRLPEVTRPRIGLTWILLSLVLLLGGVWLALWMRPRPLRIPEGSGKLIVSSVPPRAQILAIDQDGRKTEGQTPAELIVEVGDYRIEVKRDGYTDFHQQVRVFSQESVQVEAFLEATSFTPVAGSSPTVPGLPEAPTIPPASPAPPATPVPVLPATPLPSQTTVGATEPAAGRTPGASGLAATRLGAGKPGQSEMVVLPGGEEIEMVWIPGGIFHMGCENGPACDDTEQPRHPVRVEGFWMGRFELNQRQWKSVQSFNPSVGKGDPRPVDSVSWEEVQSWLQQAGQNLRLPTEAEWEYAARGGVEGTVYPWGDSKPDGSQANYCDASCPASGKDTGSNDGAPGSAPGGNYLPNPLGLYDLAGNVAEWCQDGFKPNAYQGRIEVTNAPFVATGIPSPDGVMRILRGGSWGSKSHELAVAHRDCAGANSRLNTVGFRVARSADP